MAATDLAALTKAAERLNFRVLAAPNMASPVPVFEDLLSASSLASLDAKGRDYWLDVSAPTDSRPFFFNNLRLLNFEQFDDLLAEYRRSQSFERGSSLVVLGNLVAMGTLLLLIVLSLLAVVFTILIPARASMHDVAPRLAWLGSAYFLLIGLGFMFIEIGLIQRISIFMGHPIYALGIVLFSIILSTGLGSLLSERLSPSQPIHLVLWLTLLAVYVLVLPFWLPLLANFEFGQFGEPLASERRRDLARRHPHGLRVPDGNEARHGARSAADSLVLGCQWCGRGAGSRHRRRIEHHVLDRHDDPHRRRLLSAAHADGAYAYGDAPNRGEIGGAALARQLLLHLGGELRQREGLRQEGELLVLVEAGLEGLVRVARDEDDLEVRVLLAQLSSAASARPSPA